MRGNGLNKKYRDKKIWFLKILVVIQILGLCLLIYCIANDQNKYVNILICIMLIIVNMYTINLTYSYFKKFVYDFEGDMELVSKDIKLDYRRSFQNSIYSRLYSRLFHIQENKRAYIEKQKEEMNVIHQLISDISHQVKTPITTAKTYGQMLMKRQEQDKNDKTKEYVGIINIQINKLEFLMQALLKISRLETNMIELHPENYYLDKILAEAYVGVLHSTEKKGIKVIVNYIGKHAVFVDFKWTIEALFNIIDNAVKYTPYGGRIEVEIMDSENYKIVAVKDNGSGIEEHRISLIFQRFHREKTSYEVEGLGLGLSLSKEIIEKEHGYIRVQSILNEGSTFLVYLPKAEKESSE